MVKSESPFSPRAHWLAQTSERKDVRLYYGTVAPESTAYQSDAAAWGELNVEVINVYSNGKNYYVQDAFAQVGLQGAGAGSRSRVEGSEQRVRGRGFKAEGPM